jgi:AcrR family transcriptional regulator
MNVDAPSPPALRRRARVRAATAQEIKLTARRLLVADGAKGLTLRAIARQLGMTAPALYRYFPSREDLLEHVVADLYDEVTDALEDGLPADDVGQPILAASRRFRHWALAHPDEFGLLFGSPIAAGGADRAGPAHDASRRFGRLFGELIARLYQQRPFPINADEAIEPRLAEQLREWGEDFPVPVPLGVLQLFLSCWIRLYGAVCLEVFGHLRFAVADAELIFEAELRSLAERLGAAELYHPPTA